MRFCLRVDLDYVPWDSPDAAEFGHGEPAMILRLLELAKEHEYRLQFFASNRVLHAFPSTAEAILNDGHDLDWLCKHPEQFAARYESAIPLFAILGHKPIGLAIKTTWPQEGPSEIPGDFKFLSAQGGVSPRAVRLFTTLPKTDRDSARSGLSADKWTTTVKNELRAASSVNRSTTLTVRPQVLAKLDPHLGHIQEIIRFANAFFLPLGTLRDELNERPAGAWTSE